MLFYFYSIFFTAYDIKMLKRVKLVYKRALVIGK